MTQNQQNSFPGGSKNRVNRAGDNIRARAHTLQDLRVIDEWRAAHRNVLNTFQAILRSRTKDTDIVVAQRHKRRVTIFNKLLRFPRMQLSRMDDIAGCRLIFPTIEELYAFRTRFHQARFKHKRRNEDDKYDYIQHPKPTGYRGIHDVYTYDVNSAVGRAYKGLFVELQYRTRVQHAWATAVEVIGFITESQPKFEAGDERYQTAMLLASEILSRAHEARVGFLKDVESAELVRQFVELDSQLGLLRMLNALNAADAEVSKNRNAILIFSDTGDLQIRSFRDAPDALKALFELESAHNSNDVVYVRADSSEDMRLAFKNYFSDARDFIELLEAGLHRLTEGSMVLPDIPGLSDLIQDKSQPR